MSDILEQVTCGHARFTVYRDGRPWYVAFSKGAAVGLCDALKARGEPSMYHEGVERPDKRSYAASDRLHLPSVQRVPVRNSAHCEIGFYKFGAPVRDRAFYVIDELQNGDWITVAKHTHKCVALAAAKRHQQVRKVTGSREFGFTTETIKRG